MKIKMLANFSAMNTRHFIDWIFDATRNLFLGINEAQKV